MLLKTMESVSTIWLVSSSTYMIPIIASRYVFFTYFSTVKLSTFDPSTSKCGLSLKSLFRLLQYNAVPTTIQSFKILTIQLHFLPISLSKRIKKKLSILYTVPFDSSSWIRKFLVKILHLFVPLFILILPPLPIYSSTKLFFLHTSLTPLHHNTYP